MIARFHRVSVPPKALIGIGIASALIYAWALFYGPFRPGRIEPFFVMFGAAFVLYVAAVWLIQHMKSFPRRMLITIFGFAILFSALLLPVLPNLSDDMYRYVWDGRVQAAGVNPYHYPSSAPELASLRDDTIWRRMNRINAITVYPPGAELFFAALWRFVPDSILAVKLSMVGAVFVCGWLLVWLLGVLHVPTERVLIFLWNPLMVFEVAHSAHVDALYLPLIVGAMLLRGKAPPDRVSWRYEVGIGILVGLAVLIKLYPAILLPALWSVRDEHGCRRCRLALPIAAVLTVASGYALYLAPGVDTLGFLPNYSKEFFNVGPLPMAVLRWAEAHGIAYYVPANVLMPVSVILASLYFLVFPARSAREAILRCMIPTGIYLIMSQNLFSWYVLWMLPLVALGLERGHWLGFKMNAALAWGLFSGLVVLSYTIFITGWAQEWASWVQYMPLYLGLLVVGVRAIRSRAATGNLVVEGMSTTPG